LCGQINSNAVAIFSLDKITQQILMASALSQVIQAGRIRQKTSGGACLNMQVAIEPSRSTMEVEGLEMVIGAVW
jgi:hypothetical protein